MITEEHRKLVEQEILQLVIADPVPLDAIKQIREMLADFAARVQAEARLEVLKKIYPLVCEPCEEGIHCVLRPYYGSNVWGHFVAGEWVVCDAREIRALEASIGSEGGKEKHD